MRYFLHLQKGCHYFSWLGTELKISKKEGLSTRKGLFILVYFFKIDAVFFVGGKEARARKTYVYHCVDAIVSFETMYAGIYLCFLDMFMVF